MGVLMRSSNPRHHVSAPAIGGKLCAIGGAFPFDEHLLHLADLRGTGRRETSQTRRRSMIMTTASW